MRINVTRQDILTGKPGEILDCPVQHALRRRVKPEYGVAVGGFSMFIDDHSTGGIHYRGSLPGKVTDWINRFDSGELMHPITFDIEIPKEFVK